MAVLFVVVLLAVRSSAKKLISEWYTVALLGGDKLPTDGCGISINETVYIFSSHTIIKFNPNNFEKMHRIRTNLSFSSPFMSNQNIAYNANKNRIYLIYLSFTSHVYAFDLNSDAFISTLDIPSMPIPVYSSCVAMDNTNNLLYIFGGIQLDNLESISNHLQILALDSDEWLQSVESAPISTASSSCFVSDDARYFYVLGGIGNDQILRYVLL